MFGWMWKWFWLSGGGENAIAPMCATVTIVPKVLGNPEINTSTSGTCAIIPKVNGTVEIEKC